MSSVAVGPPLVCAYHKTHSPGNYTVESHHIIPRAWQSVFVPQIPPYPGPDPYGPGTLWDCRTVEACPTGHRNTHYWIVKLMRAVTGEDPQQAAAAVKGSGVQFAWAMQALIRFQAAGGSLQALVAAHEYGEA